MKLTLYQQVANDIVAQIRSRRFLPGAKLPPDEELQIRYGASRITVQRALQELRQMGLLRRVRGHGTYILESNGTSSDVTVNSPPIRFISVIFPQGEDNGAHSILMGIEEAFSTSDYMVGIKNSRDNSRNERMIMEVLLVQKPSGVILFSTTESNKNTDIISRFLAEKIPLVLIDRNPTLIETPFVACDNKAGAMVLVDYLISKGRKRIAFVGSSLEHMSSEQERFSGYCQSLTFAGVPVDMDLVRMVGPHTPDNYNRPETETAADALVSLKADAIFAVNDLLAIALSRQLRSTGVLVPQQISIVGFDDIEFAQYVRPGITTYKQPFRQIGIEAGRLLREIIERTRDPAGPINIRVKGNLMIRDSA